MSFHITEIAANGEHQARRAAKRRRLHAIVGRHLQFMAYPFLSVFKSFPIRRFS